MANLKASYETVFILSSKLTEEATAEMVKKFTDLIAANGTVDSVDEWGKRRLAYDIDYEQEGYYVLVNFTSAPEFPAELDRIFRITEGVIRSMIVAKEVPAAAPAAVVAPAAAPAAAETNEENA